MTSSYARENANKGMQFEEYIYIYIQCGICLSTCFKRHVYKKFQMDVSRKQQCVIFPFSLHSKFAKSWFGNTHTEDRAIPEPRLWQHKCLMNHFPANLSLFGVRLVCGVKSQSRAKSCCNLHLFTSFQRKAVPLQSNTTCTMCHFLSTLWACSFLSLSGCHNKD